MNKRIKKKRRKLRGRTYTQYKNLKRMSKPLKKWFKNNVSVCTLHPIEKGYIAVGSASAPKLIPRHQIEFFK